MQQAAFTLAGAAVEMGYDLRLVCRELARVVRDLLVLSVDASRINDPEIAGESERERLQALAKRFSREDLLRAFDVLTRAEAEIRDAAQPRYHLEMALLRWIYLQKLVPMEDLLAGTPPALGARSSGQTAGRRRGAVARSSGQTEKPAPLGTRSSGFAAATPPAPKPAATVRKVADRGAASSRRRAASRTPCSPQIRTTKSVFYNTVVAQAQKIEVTRRSCDVHVLGRAENAARDVRAESRLARVAGAAGAGRKVVVTSANGIEGASCRG